MTNPDLEKLRKIVESEGDELVWTPKGYTVARPEETAQQLEDRVRHVAKILRDNPELLEWAKTQVFPEKPDSV